MTKLPLWSALVAMIYGLTLNAAAYAAFPGVMATAYGADPSGVADSAPAINACLAAAGHNGACWATGGKFKASQNIAIPANTTLACGASYPGRASYNNGYADMPAIMLDSAHTIIAVGDGAKITGCLVYRLGLTFPPPDSSAFSGTAIDDQGHADFTITDTEIIGFDSCLWVKGLGCALTPIVALRTVAAFRRPRSNGIPAIQIADTFAIGVSIRSTEPGSVNP